MKKLFLVVVAIAFSYGQTPLGPRTYQGSHTWKTHTKSLTLLSPATTDSGLVAFQWPRASTVVRVSCATIGSGTTVTINLSKRAESSPGGSGTDILSTGLVCDNDSQTSCASGCDVNTITSGGLTSRQLVFLTISAVSGTPSSLIVHTEMTDE